MESGTQKIRKRGSLSFIRKYKMVASNEWNRILTYRFSIASFRMANAIDILAQVFMWTIFFEGADIMIGGYTYDEMITYIMFGFLFSFLTTNYEYETVLAKQIQRGMLSNLIIKPIKFVSYYISIAIGRMGTTLFSSLIMQVILIIIFWKLMIMPTSLGAVIVIVAMLILGFIFRLFFALMLGLIAFWTYGIAGFKDSFNVVAVFFSGGYFPLSMISIIGQIGFFLPFAYYRFIPLELWLGKMSLGQGMIGLGIEFIWIIIMYIIVRLMWYYGVKKNEGVGI